VSLSDIDRLAPDEAAVLAKRMRGLEQDAGWLALREIAEAEQEVRTAMLVQQPAGGVRADVFAVHQAYLSGFLAALRHVAGMPSVVAVRAERVLAAHQKAAELAARRRNDG
jgi:hypothetical protein